MKSDSNSSGNDLTFWEHLDALRGVILRSLALIVTASVVAAVFMPSIFDSFILAPCRTGFATYRWLGLTGAVHQVNLINLELTSQIMIHMSTSLWAGLIIAFPGVLALLWHFVAPALYRNERQLASAALTGATFMFFAGVATGYLLVFPLTLQFLSDYQMSSMVPNHISLSSYIDTFSMSLLSMGLLFELPVAAWALGKAGVLTRVVFRRYRRHAVLVLLVLSAVLTPTTDPFTLMAVFLPVYLLWELAALLVPKGEKEPVYSQS